MWRAPGGDLRARVLQHDVGRHREEAALVDGRESDSGGRGACTRASPRRGRRRAARRRSRGARTARARAAPPRSGTSDGLAAGRARRDRQRRSAAASDSASVDQLPPRSRGRARCPPRRPSSARFSVAYMPKKQRCARGFARRTLRGDAAAEHQRRVHRHRDRHEPRRRQARARGVVERLDRQVEAGRLEAGAAQERDRRRHALRLVTGLVARDENDVARSAHGCFSCSTAGYFAARRDVVGRQLRALRRRSTSRPARAAASVPAARSGPTGTR